MPALAWTDTDGFEEIVSPIDRSPWDVVYLGGIMVPGLCEIDDGESSRKLDIKNAKGADGATITSNGYEPSKFSIRVTLTPITWPQFVAFLPLIKPKLGKPPSKPLTIDHPITAAYKVDKVIVEKIAWPKKSSLVGAKDVVIHLVEWLPAPKKAGKTDAKAKGGAPDTIVDAKHAKEYARREAEWFARNPGATRSPSVAELEGPSFSSAAAGPRPT